MSEGIDESVVDDAAALAERDPAGMLRALASAGAQVRQALRETDEALLDIAAEDGRPRAVLIAGMGGSGITADVVAAVTGTACPVPVVAHRGFRLPGWVGAADLVVGVSSSGQTEETLATVDEALRRGARVVTVGAAGSPLAQRAEGGRSVHLGAAVADRKPRANLWAMSVPVLLLVDRLGLTSVPRATLAEVADQLDRTSEVCGPVSDTFDNPAKRLALALAGSLPYVWGGSEIAATAAHRFTCQLAENAKIPAVDGALPEVAHNQVMALEGAFGAGASAGVEDIFRDPDLNAPSRTRIQLVLLADPQELPEITRGRHAVARLAESYDVPVQEVGAVDGHAVARLASLVAPCDFASVYYALLHGIDPTPIAAIDRLKRDDRP
ncbi:MAG: glucose/mannose-6-phosphate isomerase [Actinomycetota bacterium]|jgi:glucose/mannose-6-phosphate isomerase|nr:glucose/mannose-6-phosphate isomerase [Actinomycetota bacterium]